MHNPRISAGICEKEKSHRCRNLCSIIVDWHPQCVILLLHMQEIGVSTVAHLVVEHIQQHNVVPLGNAIRVQECKWLIPRLANCDLDSTAFCRITIRQALLYTNRQDCEQQDDFSLPQHHDVAVWRSPTPLCWGGASSEYPSSLHCAPLFFRLRFRDKQPRARSRAHRAVTSASRLALTFSRWEEVKGWGKPSSPPG
jgi:hypothetical protein